MSVGLFAIVGVNQNGYHLVRRGWELIGRPVTRCRRACCDRVVTTK